MNGAIQFPIYKMGKIESIETTPLGKVYVTTIRDKYVLDDTSLPASTLGRRRLILQYQGANLYKLRAKVDTLKQLIKFPSKTKFVDSNGYIFTYKKGKKRYKVVSCKILSKSFYDEGYILHIEDYPTPHYVPHRSTVDNCNFVSIMLTNQGPLVYDYTEEYHKPFNRAY